jgi:hypothetical protein
MIEKECAAEVRESCLKAITELTRLLEACRDRCSDDDYERLRRGIGLSIGRIQTELLDVVYSAYPELDDLK